MRVKIPKYAQTKFDVLCEIVNELRELKKKPVFESHNAFI